MVIYDGALVSFHKNHHPTFFTHPTGLQIGIYARAARTRARAGHLAFFSFSEIQKNLKGLVIKPLYHLEWAIITHNNQSNFLT